ncbi:MAG: NAD-dependent succinate-semialdehyde dehydrogenase [Casimicrobiaceae bacterium]
MLIGGSWLDAPGAPIVNPADDSVLGKVPHVTLEQLQDAVAAGEVGLKIWRKTAASKRADVLMKAADLLRQRVEPIATVVTLESGKPLTDAKLEVMRAASILEWDSQEARRLYGRIIPSEPGMRHLVFREPIGVVAAFSPWNAPIGSPVRKVAGALAAGCSIILKAAEETPGSAMLLAQALVDAGLPAGVLNLIFGNPVQVSEFLIPHPSIRLVALTGSVAVGKRLAAMAGAHMKPCIMELGGHSPVIVCEDVNPVAVAKAAVPAKFRNSGQLCVGVTRFYVHKTVYDEFAQTIASEASKLQVGPGLDPSTHMGPVANRRRVEAIERLIEDALACGARLLSGGSRIGQLGCFFQPTVMGDVPDHALAMHEEPFGPLVLLQRVSTLDEAIEKANSTMLGLNAYVFTNSVAAIDRCIAEIDAGYLSINHFGSSVAETPFGGVKDSGYGREGGVEGLEHYTVTRTVSMKSASPGYS